MGNILKEYGTGENIEISGYARRIVVSTGSHYEEHLRMDQSARA
jgi:hypothetical protein